MGAQSRRPQLVGAAAILLAFIMCATGYWVWRMRTANDNKPKNPPDMVAVLQANNVGVGHMEFYKYDKAISAFEKVVEMAPDWIPGRINLAIALFNQQGSEEAKQKKAGKTPLPQGTNSNTARAMEIFSDILDLAEKDPEIKKQNYDLYAHFCMAIILKESGEIEDAMSHFEAVVRRDSDDASALAMLGSALDQFSKTKEALACYEKALRIDPYNMMALYNGQLCLTRLNQDARSHALLEKFNRLETFDVGTRSKIEYGKMGKYAEVIGRFPELLSTRTGPLPLFKKNEKFKVHLAKGARWAGEEDFGKGPVADLRRAFRKRFGACMVTLDYNGDHKPDLFLLGAVVEGGKVRDLLLRNDGNFEFTDVTHEAGLDDSWPSLGCCVGDIDNDGRPDLILTGIGRQRAFRNDGKGGFKEVSAALGIDQVTTVCLGACLVDLDQDGALDLVLMQYADTAEDALLTLKGEKSSFRKGVEVFINTSTAPPSKNNEPPAPLDLKFQRNEALAKQFGMQAPGVCLAAGDFDKDRDLDLFLVGERTPSVMAVNDRLLRFTPLALPESLLKPATWNGVLVLDANHDQRSDLLVVGPGQRPVLLLNRYAEDRAQIGQWFEPGATNSPPLIQAQALDLDLDGWTDVIGLSEKRIPVLLHNDSKRLEHVPSALGADADWPKDLVALVMVDVDGDCFADLIVWSEKEGLQLRSNQGNGNHGLLLHLTGIRSLANKVRCNADAFGTWIVSQSSDVAAGLELTTLSAGLGQSQQPLVLGLGPYTQADVVRLRWPDGTLQAELNLPSCDLRTIPQENRETISCPILFAWNGQRFVFCTDFLGEGALGEYNPDGTTRPPRAEESIKIEPEQLVPLKGQFVLKIAQPMDEATYLDRLQLIVVDHPPDLQVYPDERFVDSPPYPSQALLALRPAIFPVKARDHNGKDVTQTLQKWDRLTVEDFAHRSWLGYAEDHWVELDFGDRLAKYGPKDRLVLCLAGWTDYAYPESIWAATRAGVSLQGPILERLNEDGKWQSLGETGFPAGLPRMMTVDVTGKLTGPHCVFRLKTNMQIYWDQIFVAPLQETVDPQPINAIGKADSAKKSVHAQSLEVMSATLAPRPCMRSYSPDGRQPTLYDYDRPEAVPVVRLAGKMTRFGDVTDLLREEDDLFVIFGPGEELDVRFDASKLPDLPKNWNRSFVLRTWGYCKDSAPFTKTGKTIEPLPFRAMKNYPYGHDQHYPTDKRHSEYRKKYNTRQVGDGK